MTDFTTPRTKSRTITAFFDRHEAAAKASNDMVALGISRDRVRLTEGNISKTAPIETNPPEKSFSQELTGLFLPSEDRYAYAEGLRRGGYLVSVQVEDSMHDQVVRVLDTDGAVDMDEREESWRASGWTGYEAGEVSPPPRTPPAVEMPKETRATFDEGSVFAKRDTNLGSSRLRSYSYDGPSDEFEDSRFAKDAGLIADHMDVIASDGTKIGTVDHLEGNSIKLAKSTSPDGQHHYVALTSVDHVDTHVHLNRTASEVRASW